MASNQLSKFSAVYCSGAFIPDAAAVTALALLFDKTYLPNNIEFIRAFVTKYRVGTPRHLENAIVQMESADADANELFAGLTARQTQSVKHYLLNALMLAHVYSELYGPVFESDLFPEKARLNITTTHIEGEDGRGSFDVQYSNRISLASADDSRVPELLSLGYIPVVGRFHAASPPLGSDQASTLNLAALLAMKAVEMMLPRTKAARAEVILEARDRLRDQLPPFWSLMLKASVELRKLVAESNGTADMSREAKDLVDRTIRPAVIDLSAKLEKERKEWFYRILAPVRGGLRLLVGSPPLTQQQLVTSALLLASDTCVSIAENMKSIDSLKNETGLTYLLDLSDILVDDSRRT